ncbi:MAG: iron-regulated protein frpC, partial [Roseobacter sp.]
DQTAAGLFQLDIRETETLETNFGGGDDTAVIVDNVLDEIALELDGGAGRDALDLSQASGPVSVDLRAGTIEIDNGAGVDATAVNFEIVTGTDSNDVLQGGLKDNVIRGGKGNDLMEGRGGADTFVFFEEDIGVDVILDFEFGVDTLLFATSDPTVTSENLLADLTQTGSDVELTVNDKTITIEDSVVADFSADDFMIV